MPEGKNGKVYISNTDFIWSYCWMFMSEKGSMILVGTEVTKQEERDRREVLV